MPSSASDSVRASAMTPTMVVHSGLARPKRPNKRTRLPTGSSLFPSLPGQYMRAAAWLMTAIKGVGFKYPGPRRGVRAGESCRAGGSIQARPFNVSISGGWLLSHLLAFAIKWNHSEIVLAMAKGNGRQITDGGFFYTRNRPVATQDFAKQHGFLRGGAINVLFWDR